MRTGVFRMLWVTAMAAPILTSEAAAQRDVGTTLLRDPIVHERLRGPFGSVAESEAEPLGEAGFDLLQLKPQEPSGAADLWDYAAPLAAVGALVGLAIGLSQDGQDCVDMTVPPRPGCGRRDNWSTGLMWGTGVGATAGGALYLVRRMSD